MVSLDRADRVIHFFPIKLLVMNKCNIFIIDRSLVFEMYTVLKYSKYLNIVSYNKSRKCGIVYFIIKSKHLPLLRMSSLCGHICLIGTFRS